MKAAIYDKWLHSLGGGEVVACNMAKILKDLNYDVTFVSGKLVNPEIIIQKLGIDLTGVEFKEIWNDEAALGKITKEMDLFINTSFMDYSNGYARKNIYYVHFPTKPYKGVEGRFIGRIAIPVISKLFQPIESMNPIDAQVEINGLPAYRLLERNRFAISELTPNKIQTIKFKIYLENFSKNLLEGIDIKIKNGDILDKKVFIQHSFNTLKFEIKFKPTSNTIYLLINATSENNHNLEKDEIYLLYPQLKIFGAKKNFFNEASQKVYTRLRAGIFSDIPSRLKSYQLMITHSEYVKYWTKKYWRKDAHVIYPPVDLIFNRINLKKIKKKNWICSVGRFFTLGHGKKQEVMIEAFKVLYDKYKLDWELHLVGGLGIEPSSIEFFSYLKEQAKGYPIFFHTNVSKEQVDRIYLNSKIYWHAAGIGEDRKTWPVKLEHFGIAPVEAISAGCIPILFNGGGLKEIITISKLDSKKNLFNTQEELIENTLFYSKGGNKINFDEIYKQLDSNFSLQAFTKNFKKIIG